jgi:hypothetical protein
VVSDSTSPDVGNVARACREQINKCETHHVTFITTLEKEQKSLSSFLGMGFWKYSYILALLSLEVTLTQGFRPSLVTQGSPPTCQLFQASFLAVIEATLDAADAFVIHPDHDLTFFREVMKFRDAQIQHTIDDAFKFFNDSFGLDFSVSPPNDYNQYFYENAVMGRVRTDS